MILLTISSLAMAQTAQVISTFDKNDDGWIITGDAQGEDVRPNYVAKGGKKGGSVSATDDAAGGVWYWVAPLKFLGDKSNSYGLKLKFSLKETYDPRNQFDWDDVVLIGADTTLVFDTPNNPDSTWTNYEVLLNETAGWHFINPEARRNEEHFFTGAIPSRAEFLKVLSNLKGILIRGEFISGQDEGGLDDVTLERTGSAVLFGENTLSVGDRLVLNNIQFKQSKADLRPSAMAELDKIAAFLSQNATVQIEVSGHTSNEGERIANLNLSQQRADTCKSYLLKKGIQPDRILTKGYGPDQPLRPNDTDERRAKNRRVELKVIKV